MSKVEVRARRGTWLVTACLVQWKARKAAERADILD